MGNQQELSNGYQHDRVGSDGFQNYLCPSSLDESSLTIGRFKGKIHHQNDFGSK